MSFNIKLYVLVVKCQLQYYQPCIIRTGCDDLKHGQKLSMWISRKSFQINVCYNLRYSNEHLDIFILRISEIHKKSNYQLIL